MLYEYFGGFGQVYLDGRKPFKDPNPTWMGYSTGLWNGKDLLVETTGFNGRIWLDTAGILRPMRYTFPSDSRGSIMDT